MEENKKIANKIINMFEELLKKHEIKIPNKERCGNEDEACIYGTDYYNLEDKVTEILDNFIMGYSLKTWIKNIKQEKSIEKAIDCFEELFKGYEPIYMQEVSEYFESYTERYELNDNFVTEICSGDWDKWESYVSHRGIDINIYFKESKKEKNREGITIFSESEFQDNIEELEKMIEEEMMDEVII
ncbi:MAG: hypothetical protein HFJ26_01745 [Clostridia bacterium]|nr:hypothetical protein [Clostridia bacterium]